MPLILLSSPISSSMVVPLIHSNCPNVMPLRSTKWFLPVSPGYREWKWRTSGKSTSNIRIATTGHDTNSHSPSVQLMPRRLNSSGALILWLLGEPITTVANDTSRPGRTRSRHHPYRDDTKAVFSTSSHAWYYSHFTSLFYFRCPWIEERRENIDLLGSWNWYMAHWWWMIMMVGYVYIPYLQIIPV